jgi:aerobic-type carbon monoxide dehydrogenase small subunit (CoxS/CutS family)
MFTLQVNGHEVTAARETNLLEFLREELNITSLKNGLPLVKTPSRRKKSA